MEKKHIENCIANFRVVLVNEQVNSKRRLYMNNKIKNILKTKELCEIYTNVANTDKFNVINIIALDQQYYIAESFDQYGKNDGFLCALVQNIIKLQTKTKYLNNINKLIIYNQQNSYNSLEFKDNLLFNFINMIKDNHRICTIELCDSDLNDIIGYIINIDNNYKNIEMIIINYNGEEDGDAIVDISMISYISFDSLDDKKIEILSKISN